MSKADNPFRYFHSSPDIIRMVVTLSVRYPLSLRSVEDLLFERGDGFSHETVRLGSRHAPGLAAVPRWWNRFGP
jgi:putative transposase